MGISDEAKTRRRISLDTAIDQIREYFDFDPFEEIEVHTSEGLEVFEITHSSVYSPEQAARFKALDEFVETLDHKEVPRRNTITGEILVHPVTGEVDADRVVVTPNTVDGVEIDPPYSLRWLAALWGDEDKARRGEAAGLTYGIVQMRLARMRDQFAQWQRSREKADPKSR